MLRNFMDCLRRDIEGGCSMVLNNRNQDDNISYTGAAKTQTIWGVGKTHIALETCVNDDGTKDCQTPKTSKNCQV